MTSRSGFTLVELSIVLIVIGLTLGAILVGRDLIEAGRIRQQISQIQQFRVAISTFRNKYGGLPGDLKADIAVGFGMSPRGGVYGNGNGNGLLEACDQDSDMYFGCETVLFWNDLAFAGLIPGSFNMPSTGSTITVPREDRNKYLPEARLGNQASLLAVSLSSFYMASSNVPMCHNSICFSLARVYEIDQWEGIVSVGAEWLALTPLQAFAIDSKMDDGKPFTGTVAAGISLVTMVLTDPSWYSSGVCLSMAGAGSSADDFSYATTGLYMESYACSMNFSAF